MFQLSSAAKAAKKIQGKNQTLGGRTFDLVVVDCQEDEIMRTQVEMRTTLGQIKEMLSAHPKGMAVQQQVLLQKGKPLKHSNITGRALLHAEGRDKDGNRIKTVKLQLLLDSVMLLDAPTQADFRDNIRQNARLEIATRIWGTGTRNARMNSADGGEWNRKDMVEKCTGRGPLLILLETGKGMRLGGFYPLKYELSADEGGWRRASKAFLYCLDPEFGWKIFPIKPSRAEQAIWQPQKDCDVLFTFGEGDLCIYANSYHHKHSYSELGGYYYSGGRNVDLIGHRSIYFSVKKIEVYECVNMVTPDADMSGVDTQDDKKQKQKDHSVPTQLRYLAGAAESAARILGASDESAALIAKAAQKAGMRTSRSR